MKDGLRKALDQLRQSLSPTGIADGQLLKSFITERDEAAFAALVRRHGPMVLGVCRRILRNPHDSDDAFQATFLVLVQKARWVTNQQALAAWLYTVAYRSALQVQLRNRRRQNRERQVAMRHPETKTPEAQDWQPVLDRELNRLPEKYRAPLILCDLQGQPRREAARQLRLAEGTLSSRLATARRMLAQRLRRHGITLSGGALAVSLAEASAGVPPALVALTTQSALLVAAGHIAAVSTSIGLVMKGTVQTMFLAKLKTTLTTVLVLVLGAATLVYGARGQSDEGAKPKAAGQPKHEVAAPPQEDERASSTLLLLQPEGAKNEIKALESRIKALENEVAALKRILAQKLAPAPAPPPPNPANKEQTKTPEPEGIEAVMKRLRALPALLAQSQKNDAEVVAALFEAALQRRPTDRERAALLKQFQGAQDRVVPCRDVLWALINSREFLNRYDLDRDVVGSLQLLNRFAADWESTPKK
jgi:RNA polymerase sigma factor (sigma-70 family)